MPPYRQECRVIVYLFVFAITDHAIQRYNITSTSIVSAAHTLLLVIMIVVVLGAFACLIRWRKNLLLRRQIDECMNDVFVQHQHRVRS